mmetsp:Transcript_115171/g.223761  ORF Transcript_115171/g.223761 Transcript_115171/m.223761 type:complete len:401 (-) Transcript_115171:295-1497(-)
MQTGYFEPMVEVAVLHGQDLLAILAFQVGSSTKKFYKAQERRLSRSHGSAIVAFQKHFPTFLHVGTLFAIHGTARFPGVWKARITWWQRPVPSDIPQRHARHCKRQVRTVTWISQQNFDVIPGRPREACVPTWLFVFGALFFGKDQRGVLVTLGQSVVHLLKDRRQSLVPEGKVPLVVESFTGFTAPQALHLIPYSCCEESIPTRHEKPHCGHLGMPVRVSIEAVDVPTESIVVGLHLVPIVVQRPQQHRGDVHGNATVSSQHCIHDSILLMLRVQLSPPQWQFHHVHVPVNRVHVQHLDVKAATIPVDRFQAQVDMCRKFALVGARTTLRIVPVHPDCFLLYLAVHFWQVVAVQSCDCLVKADPFQFTFMHFTVHAPVREQRLLVELLVLCADPPVLFQ